MSTTKVCNACAAEKVLEEFPTQMKRGELVTLGTCRKCKNESQMQKYFANHEDNKARQRLYHEKHRDRRLEDSRAWYADNKEKHQAYYQENREEILQKDWERGIQRRYGVSLEQYDSMLQEQNGKCAICKTEEPWQRSERFAIDHDHLTGKVRGLLCHNCNKGIGLFADKPHDLQAARNYLLRFQS